MRPHHPLLTLASAFLAMVVLGGIYIYGAFFSSIEAEFGWSRGSVSIAFSAFMTTYAVMQLVTGILYDMYGPRASLAMSTLSGVGFASCSLVGSLWQLYLLYGVITAVGMGLIYIPCTSSAMKWFPHRKGLAASFVVAGLGTGMLILTPLAKYLITTYGWRHAFLSLGLAFIAILALASFAVSEPRDSVLRKRRSLIDRAAREALKTGHFWLTYVAFTLGSLAGSMVIIHIVPYAEGRGVGPMAAAFTVSVIGVSNVIGRICMGAVLDKVGVRTTLALCFVAQAVCAWMLLIAHDAWLLYAVSAAFGLSYGWIALYAPTVGSLFGLGSVGSILGFLGTSFGVGAVVGPAAAGVIFDLTKSYLAAFTLGALMSLLSAFLTGLLKTARR
ncbi:MAG: MFS transporter [Candidatus Nezhaarchaeota archaeon]|nr:MFS transporter [Candidatus Nezhaarchaeota archaeon]